MQEGNGATKPQGVLGSACQVAVTRTGATAFVFADAVKMYAAFLGRTKNAVWVINQSVIPQVLEWVANVGGGVMGGPAGGGTAGGGTAGFGGFGPPATSAGEAGGFSGLPNRYQSGAFGPETGEPPDADRYAVEAKYRYHHAGTGRSAHD